MEAGQESDLCPYGKSLRPLWWTFTPLHQREHRGHRALSQQRQQRQQRPGIALPFASVAIVVVKSLSPLLGVPGALCGEHLRHPRHLRLTNTGIHP